MLLAQKYTIGFFVETGQATTDRRDVILQAVWKMGMWVTAGGFLEVSTKLTVFGMAAMPGILFIQGVFSVQLNYNKN